MAFRDASVGIDIVGHDKVSAVLDKMGRNAKRTESTMQKVGKNMSRALNVVAASAVAAGTALAVSAVKGAIADEKASATLAKTLRNTTKATDAQVKAVDEYISKTQNASGILDDELRPSLDRLLRSTHSITKAQKLQALAMDISAGTGKPLQAVSEALGKAYDGNFTALKRLGIKIDAETMKSKDFTKVQKQLASTFSGQLAASLNTTSGRLAVMSARWDDAKEKMGYALLDGLKPLIDYAGSPEGQKFINDFMLAFSRAATTAAKQLPIILEKIKSIGGFVSGLNLDWSKILDARALAGVAAFKMFPGPLPMKLAAAIIAWSASDVAMNSTTGPANTGKAFGQFTGNLPKTKGSVSIGGITVPKYASGGIVTRPHIGMVGEAGPEAIIPLSKTGGLGTTINVYVEGSVISERDLVFKLRNELGQLMRRQSVGTAAFGI